MPLACPPSGSTKVLLDKFLSRHQSHSILDLVAISLALLVFIPILRPSFVFVARMLKSIVVVKYDGLEQIGSVTHGHSFFLSDHKPNKQAFKANEDQPIQIQVKHLLLSVSVGQIISICHYSC